MALFLVKKATISVKYLDFVDVFLKKFVAKFIKRFLINKQFFNLKAGNQPFYGLIYSLKPIKLKTFKIYIELTQLTALSDLLNFL